MLLGRLKKFKENDYVGGSLSSGGNQVFYSTEVQHFNNFLIKLSHADFTNVKKIVLYPATFAELQK